jgi:Leucine-rich repeat (LRR) protein
MQLERLDLKGNNVTFVHPSTFRYNIRLTNLDISGNKINSLHPETFIHNTALQGLALMGNNITDVHPSTFRNNSRLMHLDMSGNKLTTIDFHTFSSTSELQWLDLQNNAITDIHPSTFRNNSNIEYLDISTNLLHVIHSDTFQYNVNLKFLSLRYNNILDTINNGFLLGINPTYLDLSGNGIGYLDNSVFRKQGQLETLILSGNMLQSLEAGTFSDCTNLRNLFLSANNISEISRSAFYGLEHLENLDLSKNNIEELNPLLFESLSISTNRQNSQVSKLKYLNLARNKIRFFNLELYFPSNTNSGTSDPTYELVSLNLSSNCLDTLDAASVRWLKHVATVTDLSGNPWKCECSALGEAWWELRHKLTVKCASPEDRRGRTWDVMEEDLCPNGHIFAKLSGTDSPNPYTSGISQSSTTEPERTEEFTESDKPTTNILFIDDRNGTSSLMPIILTVIGVLSGCILIAGGIILVVLVKKLRDSSNAPQNNDIYTPGTSYRQVPTESLKDLNSECDYATEHIYETVT